MYIKKNKNKNLSLNCIDPVGGTSLDRRSWKELGVVSIFGSLSLHSQKFHVMSIYLFTSVCYKSQRSNLRVPNFLFSLIFVLLQSMLIQIAQCICFNSCIVVHCMSIL